MRSPFALLTLACLALTACGRSLTPLTPTTSTPPALGDPSTLTAAQLTACPFTSGSQTTGVVPAGVGVCAKGTFNGVVSTASTVKCSLTFDGTGTLTFSSPYLSKSITLVPTTVVTYRHTQFNGQDGVSLTFQDGTDAAGPFTGVRIGFFYSGQPSASNSRNVEMWVSVNDAQNASCVTNI